MAATPLFVVSNRGLAVASVAMPTGPFINIRSFAVGSAVGYPVTPDQNSLNGDILYEGQVSSYSYVGDNTINLVCRLPPDAGPFDFGEVGLFLEDGTLFAKASFDVLQRKYSSLGTNLALTYTFNCLIKLSQSVAVFQIAGAASEQKELLTVAAWSEVVPAELSANPDYQLLLVKELDNRGNGTLLVQSTPTKWTPSGTYYPLGDFVLVNASSTWVEIPAAKWEFLTAAASLYHVEACSFVIETADGYFRSVASIQHVGTPTTTVRFLLNPDPLLTIPPVGAKVTIHINDLWLAWAFRLKSSPSGVTYNPTAWLSSVTSNSITTDIHAAPPSTLVSITYKDTVTGVTTAATTFATDASGYVRIVSPWELVSGRQYLVTATMAAGYTYVGGQQPSVLTFNATTSGSAISLVLTSPSDFAWNATATSTATISGYAGTVTLKSFGTNVIDGVTTTVIGNGDVWPATPNPLTSPGSASYTGSNNVAVGTSNTWLATRYLKAYDSQGALLATSNTVTTTIHNPSGPTYNPSISSMSTSGDSLHAAISGGPPNSYVLVTVDGWAIVNIQLNAQGSGIFDAGSFTPSTQYAVNFVFDNIYNYSGGRTRSVTMTTLGASVPVLTLNMPTAAAWDTISVVSATLTGYTGTVTLRVYGTNLIDGVMSTMVNDGTVWGAPMSSPGSVSYSGAASREGTGPTWSATRYMKAFDGAGVLLATSNAVTIVFTN